MDRVIDGPAAPIQEDVPMAEFFDPNAYVFAQRSHLLEDRMAHHTGPRTRWIPIVSYEYTRDNVYAVMKRPHRSGPIWVLDRKLKFVGQGFRIDPAASLPRHGPTPPSKGPITQTVGSGPVQSTGTVGSGHGYSILYFPLS